MSLKYKTSLSFIISLGKYKTDTTTNNNKTFILDKVIYMVYNSQNLNYFKKEYDFTLFNSLIEKKLKVQDAIFEITNFNSEFECINDYHSNDKNTIMSCLFLNNFGLFDQYFDETELENFRLRTDIIQVKPINFMINCYNSKTSSGFSRGSNYSNYQFLEIFSKYYLRDEIEKCKYCNTFASLCNYFYLRSWTKDEIKYIYD